MSEFRAFLEALAEFIDSWLAPMEEVMNWTSEEPKDGPKESKDETLARLKAELAELEAE